jgi:hypothetical protein
MRERYPIRITVEGECRLNPVRANMNGRNRKCEKLGFNNSTSKIKAAGFFETSGSIYRITVP